MKGWVKDYLPYIFTAGVGILGALNQFSADKKTQKLVKDTTKAEFDRLSRQKHGGPRHTG